MPRLSLSQPLAEWGHSTAAYAAPVVLERPIRGVLMQQRPHPMQKTKPTSQCCVCIYRMEWACRRLPPAGLGERLSAAVGKHAQGEVAARRHTKPVAGDSRLNPARRTPSAGRYQLPGRTVAFAPAWCIRSEKASAATTAASAGGGRGLVSCARMCARRRCACARLPGLDAAKPRARHTKPMSAVDHTLALFLPLRPLAATHPHPPPTRAPTCPGAICNPAHIRLRC